MQKSEKFKWFTHFFLGVASADTVAYMQGIKLTVTQDTLKRNSKEKEHYIMTELLM